MTGVGNRAFCTGGDLTSADDSDWARTYPNGFGGLSLRTSLTVPVIARVNGYALGAGMELVLGCDIIIAAEHAQFGMPEARLGRLPLNGGPTHLVQRLPYQAAMSLLTGRRASATELREIGLINEVVPGDELDAAVSRWVAQILVCAPSSLKAIKELVCQARYLDAQHAASLRLPETVAALESPNVEEGITVHREKRTPHWTAAATMPRRVPSDTTNA